MKCLPLLLARMLLAVYEGVYYKRKGNILRNVRVWRGIKEALKQLPYAVGMLLITNSKPWTPYAIGMLFTKTPRGFKLVKTSPFPKLN